MRPGVRSDTAARRACARRTGPSVTDDRRPAAALSVAEFAAELRAELDRAGLSVRALAARVAALPSDARPEGMSAQSLGEFTSGGERVRLPSDLQLRVVLMICETDRARAAELRANRIFLAAHASTAARPHPRPARRSDVPSVALAEHELVVHLFAPAAGPSAVECYGHLAATWRRCVDELGLTSPIRAYPMDLPPECPPPAEGDAFIAGRSRPGPGVVEVAARRVHDIVCLSLVIAPEDGTSWVGLLESWRALRAEPPEGALGSAVIAQAVLAEPGAGLDVARLTPEVAGELPSAGLLLRRGTVREGDADTPYAVWEAVEESDDAAAVNRRSHRDLVAVAPAGRIPELSAWTWSPGGGERGLPPFARYLLHAAKLRYSARVRARSGVDAMRSEVEAAVDRPAGRLPALRAAVDSLTRSTEKIEQLQVTVTTAVGNLAENAGGDQRGGLFADDRKLGAWLESTLATDLRYAQITLRAAHRVLAAAPPPGPPEAITEGEPVGLDPNWRRTLVMALVAAYPSSDELAYMYNTQLGRNLARDTSLRLRLDIVVDNAVDRAVTEGRLDGLVAAAIAGNPGNELLKALRTSGLAPHAGAIGPRERALAEQVVNVRAGFRSATAFLTRLLRLAGRVCLVEVVTGGRLVSGGTGILVGPDLVVTNHHVLQRVLDGPSSPDDVRCTFDFHELADGTRSQGSVHGLAASGLVASSPNEPAGLDYALVRLDGRPGAHRLPDGTERGAFELRASTPIPVVDTPLLILQHPERLPMQLAWENDGVVGVDDDGMRISHAVNTENGSSGSPCLTYDLELVALHHARASDTGAKHNRAVPIAKIAAELAPFLG